MATINTRIVLRNDSTANWLLNETQVLLKGEVGIEFLTDGKVKMKIGDGTTAWSALPYFGGEEAHVFEAEIAAGGDHAAAIATEVGETTLAKGDVAIVKELISEGNYQHTAYVYNGSAWAAMDGNYNAENVYFDEDFVFTKALGTVTIPSSGSTTVTAAGKNLKEFFAGLFAAEQNPNKTEPSVSVTLTGAGSYEVGTVLTPSYSATFEDGKYTYGPEPTGATVTGWAVTSTAGESFSTASGTCAELTVTDGMSYSVTAKATHTAGSVPKTNLGNDCADTTKQIAAGTKSKTSGTITGYRNSFYGTMTTKPGTMTSADIRALAGKSNKALANGAKFDVNIAVGAMRTVIAYPATLNDLSAIQDNNDSMSNIISSFTKTTVAVADAKGENAIEYKVYYMDYANPYDTTNKYTVTI